MSDQDAELVQAVATKVARAELIKRALIVIITAIVTVILVLGVQTLDAVKDAVREIRATQEAGSPALKAIAGQQDDLETAANSSTQLLELILDCLEPTSECARESAARQAEQQGAYIAAVVAAQYCTDQILPDVYTLEQMTVCVGQRLDGHEGDHR